MLAQKRTSSKHPGGQRGTLRPDGSVTAGFEVEPAAGLADSGHLDEDLTDVFVALGEAAQEQGSGIVFLIDEILKGSQNQESPAGAAGSAH